MNTQLEQDLRRALAAQAAELPADASARLLAADYRPRGAVGRAGLALAAVTVAAGVVLPISLVGLGTDAPRAFAGWSATPTRAVGGQTHRATAACRSDLAGVSRRVRVEEAEARSKTEPRPGPAIPSRGWRAVLVAGSLVYLVFLYTGYWSTFAYLAALAPVLCWYLDGWVGLEAGRVRWPGDPVGRFSGWVDARWPVRVPG